MKFIRDIIAEKTNMSGPGSDFGTEGETGNLEIPGAEIVMTNNGDFLRGGTPADKAPNRTALAAFENVDREVVPDHQPAVDLQDAFGDEIDDSFDLLAPQSDDLDPQYQTETDGDSTPEPSELFAGIWEDESISDIEEDAFPNEPFAEQEAGAGYDNPFFEESEAPQEPVTQDVDPMAHEPTPEVPLQASSPFDRIETAPVQPTSAFQRFHRKQSANATDHESADSEASPAIGIAHDSVAPVQVPAPAAGRARRQAGRVKTRLLGFGNEHQQDSDLFANGTNTGPAAQAKFPVGWMVVVAGPGCGTAFALQNGVSQIGRGEGQAVRLDYGDTSISRENHAAVAYDAEQREFFLGHGGKANLVRLNGKPVLSTEPLTNGALIRIGETTLRFVGFCGSEFDWGNSQTDGDENAQFD